MSGSFHERLLAFCAAADLTIADLELAPYVSDSEITKLENGAPQLATLVMAADFLDLTLCAWCRQGRAAEYRALQTQTWNFFREVRALAEAVEAAQEERIDRRAVAALAPQLVAAPEASTSTEIARSDGRSI